MSFNLTKQQKKKFFFFNNTEIKPEDISESQAKDQKKNTRNSSKHRGLQVKTAKEDTVMKEGKHESVKTTLD